MSGLTTTPAVLASTDSSKGWHAEFEYRLRSETSTEAVYDIWVINPNSSPTDTWYSSTDEFTIKVTFATNTWSDNGANHPYTVDDTGSTHVLLPAYTFLRPTASTASWISSGGGTGTSGGVGFTGSFYNVTPTHFSWAITHTSGFTSDQTYELHSTTMTPTFISDLVVGAASGSSSSRTHTWGTPDVIQARDAYGTIAAELTLAHATNSQKKVNCNFW